MPNGAAENRPSKLSGNYRNCCPGISERAVRRLPKTLSGHYRNPQPNVCVLQEAHFTPSEIQEVASVVGKDLFTDELCETLKQFVQAKNFGSLIVPKLRDPAETLRVVEAWDFGSDLLLKVAQERVVAVLRMAEALSPKYHVVVANPPYMGGKGMNEKLSGWLKEDYPSSGSDLMTAFMERCMQLSRRSGYWSMINLPSWMFLSSFEKLRAVLLSDGQVTSLLQCGRGLFGSDFGAVAFCVRNSHPKFGEQGVYRRLFERHVDVRTPEIIRDIFLDDNYGRFRAAHSDFQKIPGAPIVYSASKKLLECFSDLDAVEDAADCRAGLTTGDNVLFQRDWREISIFRFSRNSKSREDAELSKCRWFPCSSGGDFRKWYGNMESVVNWENDGDAICRFSTPDGRLKASPRSREYYFRDGFTWSKISSGKFSPRYLPSGFIFDDTGQSGFVNGQDVDVMEMVSLICSKTSQHFLSYISQTLSFNKGDIEKIPMPKVFPKTGWIAENAIRIARSDWDSRESSWDFGTFPLLEDERRMETIAESYANLRAHWCDVTEEMQRLEEENNRNFIDAYGLGGELVPEVPREEVTLTCNPAYRYRGNGTAAQLEERLRKDTVAEFLHYAVGCMFGRYSLDAPGLILANQGEGLADYLARVPTPSFEPDEDNIIPVLDGEWFADDINERFRRFLRVTFGDNKYKENVAFIESTLGKPIRKWFVRDFYKIHSKMYGNRPIYWMFASPNGTFNALIYMHRYKPDTASILLNDYVREFKRKLEGERERLKSVTISADSRQGEKTKAQKDITALNTQIQEMEAWERDVLLPLAQQRIEIDLDDGVKVNYPKFGKALKAVPGLGEEV
ncbi:BREX-1 system adenine-specific DNA-methyltransferase PglX [Siculibacillus lacustris]|uniref:site-specific DNA-methyltransferase (adenine-specific) n=1 Tax=Siculibacillus lacustris TaxID=1549641 RepID=A0A4Q9VEI4_9HYPH|nr:BREX-1 system adenine-specific DNA-methyltransferase PglX [Siculibacillus lacustris]TBW32408.1 BREX-1 system adenine-specific DNA-methyltransferase PglX [Siculibacillus lacustris]